jgi:hypothetical protein
MSGDPTYQELSDVSETYGTHFTNSTSLSRQSLSGGGDVGSQRWRASQHKEDELCFRDSQSCFLSLISENSSTLP